MNAITLIHLDVPMMEPFRISSGEVRSKESILVQIERNGATAFGEASPMSGAFYSRETPDSSWNFLRESAIPRMIAEGTFHPEFVLCSMAENDDKFAWAGLEGALWDLAVQEDDVTFCDRLGVQPAPIASGLAVGIYPTISELVEACRRYMKAGYKRLKIKIQPGWDIEPLRAVRGAFPNVPLMVDANAAYSEEHFPIFDEIDKMGLLMIEQPLAEKNISGSAQLQSRLATPVCLDESAYDLAAVERALQCRACRIVNIKIQRVGGLLAAKRIYDLCAAQGVPNWMGTMPELGIGALHALYMALLPNCSYPTDVEASRRWFADDIIDPPIEVVVGWIEIPEAHRRRPTVNRDIVDKYTIRRVRIGF
ncbi:MAG: o-succinylbenzoate synthase [Candidatus Omnitrophota bacterium]